MARQHILDFLMWATTQTDRRDAIGDFCRDFVCDDCARDVRTLSGLDRHMREEHDAIDAALEARDRAWREYARSS